MGNRATDGPMLPYRTNCILCRPSSNAAFALKVLQGFTRLNVLGPAATLTHPLCIRDACNGLWMTVG
jgi:hypothetical protein